MTLPAPSDVPPPVPLPVALDAAADLWSGVAAATGPADRAATEAAIHDAYRDAGLPAPSRILWYGSPLAAAIATLVVGGGARPGDLAARGLPVRAPAALRAGELLTARLRAASLGRGQGPGWAQAWGASAERLVQPVATTADRVRDAVAMTVDIQTGRRFDSFESFESFDDEFGDVARQVREATFDAMGGQYDAGWLGVLDALRRADPTLPDNPVTEAVGRVARGAGLWWPYERVVLVSERPLTLHRDDQGRLHRADGPAVEFPDGFALFAWHGMPVPQGFVESLGPGGAFVNATRIRRERNVELRRVMLEMYGYDRYLREVQARPLHSDETGVLWRIDLPDDEPVVMVEVVNSTPEPDGSRRTYWLRVPPHTRTARAGVAWTFGVPERDYHPQRQT